MKVICDGPIRYLLVHLFCCWMLPWIKFEASGAILLNCTTGTRFIAFLKRFGPLVDTRFTVCGLTADWNLDFFSQMFLPWSFASLCELWWRNWMRSQTFKFSVPLFFPSQNWVKNHVFTHTLLSPVFHQVVVQRIQLIY